MSYIVCVDLHLTGRNLLSSLSLQLKLVQVLCTVARSGLPIMVVVVLRLLWHAISKVVAGRLHLRHPVALSAARLLRLLHLSWHLPALHSLLHAWLRHAWLRHTWLLRRLATSWHAHLR